MGLDGTIQRSDGEPLGELTDVQRVLIASFPNSVFGLMPSGEEKIREAEARGIIFPDIIRKHLESSPAHFGGTYEGPDFSVEFDLGSTAVVQNIYVTLSGMTQASEPMFQLLESQYGWISTFP